MSKEDNTAEDVAMTLRGFKKCSLCKGRGKRLFHNPDLGEDSVLELICSYCHGKGWVVPRIVKIPEVPLG